MSAAHIYGDPPHVVCNEESPFGYGLAPAVGREWEDEFHRSVLPSQRGVILRTSFVIGRDRGAGGGPLARLRTLVRLGLGGTMGSGEQGMSWLHEADMNRLFERALIDSSMHGAYIGTRLRTCARRPPPLRRPSRRFTMFGRRLQSIARNRIDRPPAGRFMTDVTEILRQIERGEREATDRLLPAVYDELRRLAASQLAAERPEHTLNPTALVHEAYLRMVRQDGGEPAWNSRGHFFGAAAEAMRRVLVEHARRKHALKRGGDFARSSLEVDEIASPERRHDLLALDAALAKLETQQPSLAQLVKLRYFAGLTSAQAAEALGTSLRTAERNWTYAKSWLLRELEDD